MRSKKLYNQLREQVKTYQKKIVDKVFNLFLSVEIDRCAICLDDCVEIKQLDKCGHTFCTACIDYYFQTVKPQCPCCFTIYGEIRGLIRFLYCLSLDTCFCFRKSTSEWFNDF